MSMHVASTLAALAYGRMRKWQTVNDARIREHDAPPRERERFTRREWFCTDTFAWGRVTSRDGVLAAFAVTEWLRCSRFVAREARPSLDDVCTMMGIGGPPLDAA